MRDRAAVDVRLRAARMAPDRDAFREFLSRDYVKHPGAGFPGLTVRAAVAGAAEAAMSALGKRLDQFASAYLRVNEVTCVGRGLSLEEGNTLP